MSAVPRKLLIEGVGDVVQRFYLPALRRLRSANPDLELFFADESTFWRNVPGLREKIEATIGQIRDSGATYLDKATHRATYEDISPDVVIVATPDATHIGIVEEWLGRTKSEKRPFIYVEKPLTHDLNEARRLLGCVAPKDPTVFAFDHYLPRTLMSPFQGQTLNKFVVGDLNRINFFFLEDHSGDDASFASAGRDGAIENERREVTLKHGVVLDMMPHVLAVLSIFVRVESTWVTGIRCGQYTGVDGEPERRSSIDKETFAAIDFMAGRLETDEPVEITAYVGKGIRGVQHLRAERNVKCLELIGSRGQRARIDFASGRDRVTYKLLDQAQQEEVSWSVAVSPHDAFLHAAAADAGVPSKFVFSIQTAKRLIEIIDDIRWAIPEREQIPAYPGGMSSITRPSLYLEDLDLPPIYGGASQLINGVDE